MGATVRRYMEHTTHRASFPVSFASRTRHLPRIAARFGHHDGMLVSHDHGASKEVNANQS